MKVQFIDPRSKELFNEFSKDPRLEKHVRRMASMRRANPVEQLPRFDSAHPLYQLFLAHLKKRVMDEFPAAVRDKRGTFPSSSFGGGTLSLNTVMGAGMNPAGIFSIRAHVPTEERMRTRGSSHNKKWIKKGSKQDPRFLAHVEWLATEIAEASRLERDHNFRVSRHSSTSFPDHTTDMPAKHLQMRAFSQNIRGIGSKIRTRDLKGLWDDHDLGFLIVRGLRHQTDDPSKQRIVTNWRGVTMPASKEVPENIMSKESQHRVEEIGGSKPQLARERSVAAISFGASLPGRYVAARLGAAMKKRFNGAFTVKSVSQENEVLRGVDILVCTDFGQFDQSIRPPVLNAFADGVSTVYGDFYKDYFKLVHYAPAAIGSDTYGEAGVRYSGDFRVPADFTSDLGHPSGTPSTSVKAFTTAKGAFDFGIYEAKITRRSSAAMSLKEISDAVGIKGKGIVIAIPTKHGEGIYRYSNRILGDNCAHHLTHLDGPEATYEEARDLILHIAGFFPWFITEEADTFGGGRPVVKDGNITLELTVDSYTSKQFDHDRPLSDPRRIAWSEGWLNRHLAYDTLPTGVLVRGIVDDISAEVLGCSVTDMALKHQKSSRAGDKIAELKALKGGAQLTPAELRFMLRPDRALWDPTFDPGEVHPAILNHYHTRAPDTLIRSLASLFDPKHKRSS